MTAATMFCGSNRCDNPTTDTTLCNDCTRDLEKRLAEIPALFDDLRIATTKQVRFSNTGGGVRRQHDTDGDKASDPTLGLATTPIPFNTAASDKTAALKATVCVWQARYADHLGEPVRYPNPITASAWMLHHNTVRGMQTFVDAGQMLDSFRTVMIEAERVIDRPADKWFAGICSIQQPNGDVCQYGLYATASNGTITCPACGYVHDVSTRRETLLKHAEEVLATATEAARAIVVWSDYERGENLLVKRIGMWAERKRIAKAGVAIVGGKERPTYRIGDILDLLADDSTQKAS